MSESSNVFSNLIQGTKEMVRKRRRDSTKSSVSKSKLGITLTSGALETLSKIAKETGLSKSELVESVAKGSIAIASNSANTTITLDTGPENGTKISVVNGDKQSQGDSPTVLAEDYDTLKQQAGEMSNLVEQLKQQLAEQKSLASEKASSSQELQQQLSEKDNQISELQNQLSEEQSNLSQSRESNQSLQKEFEAKSNQLSEMESKLVEQESLLADQAKNNKSKNLAIAFLSILFPIVVALLIVYYNLQSFNSGNSL